MGLQHSSREYNNPIKFKNSVIWDCNTIVKHKIIPKNIKIMSYKIMSHGIATP